MSRTLSVVFLIVFLSGFAIGSDIQDPAVSVLTPDSPLYASMLVKEEREIKMADNSLKSLDILENHMVYRVIEMDALVKRKRLDYLGCLSLSYRRNLRKSWQSLRDMYRVGKLPREKAETCRKNLQLRIEALREIDAQVQGENKRYLRNSIRETEQGIRIIDAMLKGAEIVEVEVLAGPG